MTSEVWVRLWVSESEIVSEWVHEREGGPNVWGPEPRDAQHAVRWLSHGLFVRQWLKNKSHTHAHLTGRHPPDRRWVGGWLMYASCPRQHRLCGNHRYRTGPALCVLLFFSCGLWMGRMGVGFRGEHRLYSVMLNRWGCCDACYPSVAMATKHGITVLTRWRRAAGVALQKFCTFTWVSLLVCGRGDPPEAVSLATGKCLCDCSIVTIFCAVLHSWNKSKSKCIEWRF